MLFNRKKDDPDAIALIHEAVKEVESGDAVLLDVRTQKEWDGGHFAGAIHIPVDEIKDASTGFRFDSLDQDKKIYVHCAKGIRATTAANKLNEMGYDASALKVTFEKIHQEGFGLSE